MSVLAYPLNAQKSLYALICSSTVCMNVWMNASMYTKNWVVTFLLIRYTPNLWEGVYAKYCDQHNQHINIPVVLLSWVLLSRRRERASPKSAIFRTCDLPFATTNRLRGWNTEIIVQEVWQDVILIYNRSHSIHILLQNFNITNALSQLVFLGNVFYVNNTGSSPVVIILFWV